MNFVRFAFGILFNINFSHLFIINDLEFESEEEMSAKEEFNLKGLNFETITRTFSSGSDQCKLQYREPVKCNS